MLFRLGKVFSMLDLADHFLVDICTRYEILEKVQRFRVQGCGFRFQPSRRPKKRPVKLKKKLMNVEHRTSNIERRMNVFCLF